MFNVSTLQWTWMNGSQSANATGVYGTQGIAAPGNAPGGHTQAASWTDSQGMFWLFGGQGAASVNGATGNLNDLWMYNPTTAQWTWINGSNLVNSAGSMEPWALPPRAIRRPRATCRPAGPWVADICGCSVV
jgi:hypothetical protein